MHKQPLILAIDTSCDETSVAVTSGTTILANVISSQAELHKPYGGVFPTVAKQAHKERLKPATSLALHRARVEWSDISAIAVTQGPGLAPALEVGIAQATDLSLEQNKPLIMVNHIEGHVLSVVAQPKSSSLTSSFQVPALSLVISGGHSDFILVSEIGRYQRLGQTIDDAAGECLDKVGRMLDLGYPAGPVVETFAKTGNPTAIQFPLPMTSSGDYNLSFSGLKTFARNTIAELEAQKALTPQTIADISASLQAGVFRHITHKLRKILTDHTEIRELWLGGGVAANITLRADVRKIGKEFGLGLRVPYTKKLCGDNAAMIGVVAGYKWQRGETLPPGTKIDRKPHLEIEQKEN